MDLPKAKKSEDSYNHIDAVLALDGQKDGQTEMVYQYRACWRAIHCFGKRCVKMDGEHELIQTNVTMAVRVIQKKSLHLDQ